MSALLTAILVVLLFCIMMGTVATDEARRLGRRCADLEDRLKALEARTRLSAVPSQRKAG